MDLTTNCEIVQSDDKADEVGEKSKEIFKKFEKEEFAYLNNSGFSSEAFKIEIKNLPKYYGYGELKKMINVTCKLDCNKIKIPRKNSPFGFLCFRNDEGKSTFRTGLRLACLLS